ncbi:MAG: (Fe-S)-binding protein [Peptococcaceae bacterium]|nr:(Fe-S)-binding protein [Peptococcaceae bacterium]
MAVEMKLPPVLDIIRSNIVKYGNPLALKGGEVAAWAKSLNLPAQGELLFYTGGEYQLLPYIDTLVKTMTKVDQASKGFSLLMGVRNVLDKAGINAEKMYASVLAKDKERYNTVCYKAAVILRQLGYELSYSGEHELYSGALLYELGYWDDLRAYAPKVANVIAQSGAKTIVCLSPHAAEVFKYVYPKLLPDFAFEIKTFVELVWEKRDLLPQVDYAAPVVIHDSCRLARELGIDEQLRDILTSVGVQQREALRNRKWTTCCGGPNKLLFPEISHEVAERRVNELTHTEAETILTSCPYCLSALENGNAANAGVEDLIEFLYRGVKP